MLICPAPRRGFLDADACLRGPWSAGERLGGRAGYGSRQAGCGGDCAGRSRAQVAV